ISPYLDVAVFRLLSMAEGWENFARIVRYSWRRAAKGSTRHARIAGTQAARTVITSIVPAQAASNEGGGEAVAGRTRESTRTAVTEMASPAMLPAATSSAASRATIARILPEPEPSATRIPISRVRRETEYARTP